ncbi:MAG: hypothetical protein P8X46_06225, partial [Nitrospirales bacterium]
EIHMGTTRREKAISPCFRILNGQIQHSSDQAEERDDGAIRADGLVWEHTFMGSLINRDFAANG